jgi:hypothetical protein
MAEETNGSENTQRRRLRVNFLGLVTAFFVIAALAIVALVVYLFVSPDNNVLADLFEKKEEIVQPTRVAKIDVSTVEPTIEPTNTRFKADLPPTLTPIPEGLTPTTAPIGTLGPTLTPSTTPTIPPPTPTRTPTPTPTETPTPGPPPTATNTRSPFPFTKTDDTPDWITNFANNAGCNWLGIGGSVRGLDGNPVPRGQYRVHVWDGGLNEHAIVGDADVYGSFGGGTGYEQFIFDAPRVETHNVQLETINGTPVSQVYRVQTRASCNDNLLLLNFVQNH